MSNVSPPSRTEAIGPNCKPQTLNRQALILIPVSATFAARQVLEPQTKIAPSGRQLEGLAEL